MSSVSSTVKAENQQNTAGISFQSICHFYKIFRIFSEKGASDSQNGFDKQGNKLLTLKSQTFETGSL